MKYLIRSITMCNSFQVCKNERNFFNSSRFMPNVFEHFNKQVKTSNSKLIRNTRYTNNYFTIG